MRKEMMELVGKEFSFTELDNEMMGLGCGTEFDSGLDWDEIAESGVILYAIDEEHHARVEFEVVSMHADDEIAEVTVIKVTNVEVEE